MKLIAKNGKLITRNGKLFKPSIASGSDTAKLGIAKLGTMKLGA